MMEMKATYFLRGAPRHSPKNPRCPLLLAHPPRADNCSRFDLAPAIPFDLSKRVQLPTTQSLQGCVEPDPPTAELVP